LSQKESLDESDLKNLQTNLDNMLKISDHGVETQRLSLITDMNQLTQILDLNQDGQVTVEDFQLFLEQKFLNGSVNSSNH